MTEQSPKSCFLCGIGGSGVSALASLLLARGWRVSGSDRSRDRGDTPEKFARLEAQGITLHPQDGSGVTAATDMVVVSSAVEETVADIQAARKHGVPVRKRADILAELFNAAELSIAVGGTSGKSTTTAMTGWILHHAGREPTVINGAQMGNFRAGDAGLGNAVIGSEGIFVAEVDESDGSIALFRPSIAVLTNVTLDHKAMDELHRLFGDYLASAQTVAVLNLDDPESRILAARAPQVLTFALDREEARFRATDIAPHGEGVRFHAADRESGAAVDIVLQVPGRHNVANALAAIAATSVAGVTLQQAAEALGQYKGLHRRFETVGIANRITVIDDFGHNPDKIAATLKTLRERPGRVWAMFQIHGFGPARLMRKELVETFATLLSPDDMLLLPEIYYAGGTVTRDISSMDIVNDIKARGKKAQFFEKRADVIPFLREAASPGDRIVIMGARDDTLPIFAHDIVTALKEKASGS